MPVSGGAPGASSAPEHSEARVPEDWKTHVEAGQFRVSYPAGFRVNTGAAAGAGQLGTALLRVTLPENYFGDAKTNLVEAYAVVGASPLTGAAESCAAFSDVRAESESREPKRVHGVVFASRANLEAAAGNLYAARLYRAAHANRCYEVALIVHTGNIGNYPAGAVQKFDDERAFQALEQVFETFQFEG